MERENSQQPLPDLELMAAEKGRPLDVEDLDDAGWKAASAKGMIEERGSLGEGAGGAVTKSILKNGKTVFALKVCSLLLDDWFKLTLIIDYNYKPRPRRQEADSARAAFQQKLRK
jgi:mitogen-activated protein kinase kinase